MKYYAYKGRQPLGSETLGADNRMIISDLKTTNGAARRCKKAWGANFKLYSFTNFYDNNTFKELK